MKRLIAFDLRLLLRSRIAPLAVLAMLVVCAIAVANGRALSIWLIADHATAHATAEADAAKTVKRIAEATGPADTIFLAVRKEMPVIAQLPAMPDFSAGRARIDPMSTTVRYATRSDTIFANEALDNPELLARGALDLGFVCLVIAPLLLIALGFDVYARDRENGTAALILAQGGNSFRLLLARSIVRLALICIPILGAAVVLLALGPHAPGRLVAAAAWLGISFLYLMLWWSLILLVNGMRFSAEASGIVLTALWLAIVIVAPTLVMAAAQSANPPPSRFALLAAARAAEIKASSAYDNDHPDLQRDDLAGWFESLRKTDAVTTSIANAVGPLSGKFDAQLAAQQVTMLRFQFLSPTLVADAALTRIAGTDAGSAADFRAAARSYSLEVRAALRPFIVERRLLRKSDIEALPSFTWKRSHPSVGLEALFIAAFGFVVGLFAWRRLRDSRVS